MQLVRKSTEVCVCVLVQGKSTGKPGGKAGKKGKKKGIALSTGPKVRPTAVESSRSKPNGTHCFLCAYHCLLAMSPSRSSVPGFPLQVFLLETLHPLTAFPFSQERGEEANGRRMRVTSGDQHATNIMAERHDTIKLTEHLSRNETY